MVYTLEKKDAVIHIASIDVKIIRLEKKQVTLSVFRQLEEKSIFSVGRDKTPTLLGKPWGRVNYVWKGCPSWATYHIVWQTGNDLRRMPFAKIIGVKKGKIYTGCSICKSENQSGARVGALYWCNKCQKNIFASSFQMYYPAPDWINNLKVLNALCNFEDFYPSGDCYQKFLNLFQRLEKLDQLFIAV